MAKKKTPLRRPEKKNAKDKPQIGRFGLLGVVTELIEQLMTPDGPADVIISQFFKQKSFLGHRDRGIVAEAAYCWLRFRLRISHLAQSGSGSSGMRQAKMALLWSGAPEEIWSKGKQEDNEWLSRVVNVSPNDLPLEPKTCLPEWLVARLTEQFGAEKAMLFAASVLEPAPLDLRVNTLKVSQDEVIRKLSELDIQAQPIDGLPNGLRVVGKPALGRTDYFQNGWFEVQDAGSQWVSNLVAPRRGDLVIDFCAGAGGKTLAISALMKNTGRVVAVDTHERRLAKFKPRAARSGLSNCATLLIADENDPRLNKYYGKADRVLTDVPCSGLGTLRRNPDLKFRQSEKTVAQMVAKQKSIIEAASRLVRPDGRLIYVTCSVLKEENEAIVNGFLSAHPEFRLRRWTEVLNPKDRPAGADEQQDVLRLWPDQTNTDGFFAAVLQKEKADVEG
ncbi:MAG: RsmB/NOP family class I SAM-dependent RNA methyltransferase [Limnobacter sp.]|nr:RsmB/NOP family class I SAM-dependent RNA methyltransferase [Limnobacter sp.]